MLANKETAKAQKQIRNFRLDIMYLLVSNPLHRTMVFFALITPPGFHQSAEGCPSSLRFGATSPPSSDSRRRFALARQAGAASAATPGHPSKQIVLVGRVTPCAPVLAERRHCTSGGQRTDPPYQNEQKIISPERIESHP